MKTKSLKYLLVIQLFFSLISCKNSDKKLINKKQTTNSTVEIKKNNKTKTIDTSNIDNSKTDLSTDNLSIPEKTPKKRIDTIKYITPDSLLFPDNIYKVKKIDFTYYQEKAFWFTNKKNNRIIIFSFGTDYYRTLQALFDKENFYSEFFTDIPLHLLKHHDSIIEIAGINNKGGHLIKDTIIYYDTIARTNTPKKINQIETKKINILKDKYFITKKGFKIGTHISKALKYYGKPTSITSKNNIKKLYWKFLPIQINDKAILDNNKLLLNYKENKVDIDKINDKNSIYYQRAVMINVFYPELYMFFNNNKLIGIIIIDGEP